jgi:hypothetical protein
VVRYRSSCNTKLLALYFFKIVPQMARRPDREKEEILSEKDLKELRCNLAHLSLSAVQEFYQRAYQDCRWSTTVFRVLGRCKR